MPYEFEHVHLKAPDPEKTANWYVEAFKFEIFSDRVMPNAVSYTHLTLPPLYTE